MKKIKWENITALLLGGAYIQHSLSIQFDSIGYMIGQYLIIVATMLVAHQMVKALRTGKVKEAIKEMFTE